MKAVYSILYYNCEVWLLPSLSRVLKQHVLSASANALRMLNGVSDLRLSYEQLHKIQKRANPQDVMRYKLSIQLYKIFNGEILNDDWIDLNFQQNFNARTMCVHIKGKRY